MFHCPCCQQPHGPCAQTESLDLQKLEGKGRECQKHMAGKAAGRTHMVKSTFLWKYKNIHTYHIHMLQDYLTIYTYYIMLFVCENIRPGRPSGNTGISMKLLPGSSKHLGCL